MKKLTSMFGLLALAICGPGVIARALAYGPNGHETVGYIADELIQGTSAEAHVKALLGTNSLGDAATWADRAKAKHLTDPEMIAFVQTNVHHHAYHYTDVPIQEVQYVDGTAGTSKNDVVHIAKQCLEVLRGNDTPATNPHKFSPRLALMLLAHYVGDLHQPLHVGAAYFRTVQGKEQMADPNTVPGCAEDLGGNWIQYNKSTALHVYWDDNTVAAAMARAGARTAKVYAANIVGNSPVVSQTSGVVTDWPQKWAEEMLPLAAKAHHGLKLGPRTSKTEYTGTHPEWTVTKAPKNYETWARDTVDERLTTAGYRLAQILHAIWP